MTASDSRRWWALGALSLSVLVVALDLFVLTLALPTLSSDLHASSGDLQWFVDSYSLVLAAALLPAGMLGDRFGRKRMLTIALAVFGLASLACAYSTSAGALIAARAVLGLAAAVILPMSLAVLPVLFTAAERPRAIAAVGGATFLGYPIGPILGGWLLDHFWWGSVFLINIPVVIIAVVAVVVLMPESHGERRARVDVTGIVISSAGLTSLTYGLIKAGDDGWSDRVAIVTMVAGVVALAAFAAWERLISRQERAATIRQPLVDLGLFGSAGFTWGTVLSTLVSFALFGLVFAMPQYFLDVRGVDSLGAGLRMLPMIGGLALGLAFGQRLQTPRKSRASAGAAGEARTPVSPKILVAIGFAIMAGALATGSRTTIASSTGFAATWFAITGFGLGVAMPTALNAALGALAPSRSGSGSALITAMRQVGGTIGVAVLGTVLATVYRSHLDLSGLPAAAAGAIRQSVAGGVATAHAAGSAPLLDSVRLAYVHGLDVMLWVCSGIAIVSALLALAFLPGRTSAPPEPEPELEPAADGTAEDTIGDRAQPATSALDKGRMTT
ncbi:MAG TPA: DHA2 family efflux MFS transporter permease subunit [Streptosporangiaceae bacterium]|nr:DHA2 family efflux MFS transporter permease subunit [Streptosporangiaceae bacterium]